MKLHIILLAGVGMNVIDISCEKKKGVSKVFV